MSNKLYIETIGTGRPLIILHGWGWHSGVWQPLRTQLAEYFQLFLIDLPGFGKSPDLSPYTVESIANEIFKLVPEESAWLGWSLGGMIAWWVALNYPAKVNKLITIASSPKFTAAENWPGVSPAILDKFKTSFLLDQTKTLKEFLELQLRGHPHSDQLFSELNAIFFQENSMSSSSNGFLGGLELLRTLDLRENLHTLQCPSLHLFGSHDTLVPKNISPLLSSLLPTNSHCEMIKRTGHMPFITHRDLVAEAIIKFILSG
jgi:pimeloyl-[acyl-carrier protein] methyl ester esterase